MPNIGNSMNSEQIKIRANEILSNKQKVDLGKDDLEVLWEFTKQDKSLNLPADLSDEEVLAMMDLLDNERNTAKNGYALFKNWLNDAILSGFALEDKDEPVLEIDPNVVKFEPEHFNTIKFNKNNFFNTLNTTKTFLTLYRNAVQMLEIDGKSYTIENQSNTSNNFAYYVENGVLVVEGSDLKIVSNSKENEIDNIKVIGNSNTLDLKQGDDNIEVEGRSNMIYAGAGEDFIKVRGDMNSVDMGVGEDTVWIAGNNNQAHGGDNAKQKAINSDKFYAMGASNNLFGQDGVDAAYYNTTDSVEGEFEAGVGQELRIEETITDGSDFEDWVNRNDDDGPPYNKLPEALDGHEVRAYDDNTYTDKYEKTPIYYTEYRDIAYRELSALTTQNKETGEGSVVEYNGSSEKTVTIKADGSVFVSNNDFSILVAASDVVYYDENKEAVSNTGSLESTLENLATKKLFVGDKNGIINLPEIITPEPPIEVQPDIIISKNEKDGVITKKYNPDVALGDITSVENTNNNTGRITSGMGINVSIAANGNITVQYRTTGLNSYTYEPDNTRFYDAKTSETVDRPEKLSDLLDAIAISEIKFESKNVLPEEKDGHTITQVDDKYYTDSYVKDNQTITVYKDIKYRTKYAQMTTNNETGEASYTRKNYAITAEGDTTYSLDKDFNLSVKNGFYDYELPVGKYEIQDKEGNIVEITGAPHEIIYKLMTGEWTLIKGDFMAH